MTNPILMLPVTDVPADARMINRELSLLNFNRRVLELAVDESIPLLERLRYLCISSSNLDEAFEVRVASLVQQVQLGVGGVGECGMTPQEQLERVLDEAHGLVADQYRVLNEVLIPAMRAAGIHFARRTHWSKRQADWVRDYFLQELAPVLTPLGLDPAHPFPRVLNKSLNFVVTLEGLDDFGRETNMAVVQAPRSLPRIVPMPQSVGAGAHDFVFLSSMIHAHVDELFPGMKVTGCFQFRVTRIAICWWMSIWMKTCCKCCKVACLSATMAVRCALKWRITAPTTWRITCWRNLILADVKCSRCMAR